MYVAHAYMTGLDRLMLIELHAWYFILSGDFWENKWQLSMDTVQGQTTETITSKVHVATCKSSFVGRNERACVSLGKSKYALDLKCV